MSADPLFCPQCGLYFTQRVLSPSVQIFHCARCSPQVSGVSQNSDPSAFIVLPRNPVLDLVRPARRAKSP